MSAAYFERDAETDALVGGDAGPLSGIGQLGDDEEFGGTDMRNELERNLLKKLDARMSILVVIYILNYVRGPSRNQAAIVLMLFKVDRNNIS